MPVHFLPRLADPDCHATRTIRTENNAMRTILRGLAVMTALAGGNAVAVDPTDEDVSYLPQSQLENLAGNRYGYDKTAYRKCMDASRKKAAGTAEEVATACRLKATPKRCRDLSAQPGEKGSKSAQEICAGKCRTAGGQSAEKGACSLY